MDNGWFIAFAPYDKPQIVVVVMFEHSGFGSQSAAPVVKKMMDAYFRVGSYQNATADTSATLDTDTSGKEGGQI